MCLREFDSIGVMVNNAGITRDATIRTMTVDAFDAVIEVHLKGAWLGTKFAAAAMREHSSGSIINISSLSGKVGMVGQTNYSAAKLFLASDLSSYITGTVIEVTGGRFM